MNTLIDKIFVTVWNRAISWDRSGNYDQNKTIEKYKSELLKAIMKCKPDKKDIALLDPLPSNQQQALGFNICLDQWENNIKQLFGEEE